LTGTYGLSITVFKALHFGEPLWPIPAKRHATPGCMIGFKPVEVAVVGLKADLQT